MNGVASFFVEDGPGQGEKLPKPPLTSFAWRLPREKETDVNSNLIDAKTRSREYSIYIAYLFIIKMSIPTGILVYYSMSFCRCQHHIITMISV